MGIKRIRIGTRGSALALAQTELVEQALKRSFPDLELERIVFKTEGDRNRQKPLAELGGVGVFVKELEKALIDDRIDIAVHSAKDMPVSISDGLCIAGVLERADVRDVLVYRKEFGKDINGIEAPFIVGTGSPRRQQQLKKLYPHFSCVSVRGNVPTRLDKVKNGECDGVILAAAGLTRLGLMDQEDFYYHLFSEEEMLPAGGQAIIAIEGRVSDEAVSYVEAISDDRAYAELLAERYVLRGLNAGCHEPVGVRASVQNDEISIVGVRSVLRKSEGADMQSGEDLCDKVDRCACRKGSLSDWEKVADDVVAELSI